MKGWQKLICRAGVIGGLSFIGKLMESGYPPRGEHFYFAGLMFALAFFAFINTAFENNDLDGDGKVDKKDKEATKEKRLETIRGLRKQVKAISFILPNLWFP